MLQRFWVDLFEKLLFLGVPIKRNRNQLNVASEQAITQADPPKTIQAFKKNFGRDSDNVCQHAATGHDAKHPV